MKGSLGRFLATRGAMGHMPNWYRVIRAARYLGVAPWDLLKQPYAWIEWAEEAMEAENHAAQVAEEQARMRAR